MEEINHLRNLVLVSAVTTSHVVLVDIDYWLRTDVHRRLMAPNIREEKNQLAIVVPVRNPVHLKDWRHDDLIYGCG